jgi:hypothetical protein
MEPEIIQYLIILLLLVVVAVAMVRRSVADQVDQVVAADPLLLLLQEQETLLLYHLRKEIMVVKVPVLVVLDVVVAAVLVQLEAPEQPLMEAQAVQALLHLSQALLLPEPAGAAVPFRRAPLVLAGPAAVEQAAFQLLQAAVQQIQAEVAVDHANLQEAQQVPAAPA